MSFIFWLVLLLTQSDSESEREEEWPAHTKLQGNGLTQQNVYVRAVCHKAIKIVEKVLVFEQAWPELHRAAEYRVEILTQAAKELEKSGTQYRDIRKRVKKDDDYAKTVGKWVIDRLPQHRGPIRLTALDQIQAVFQLGVDDVCAKRVNALLATDTYVYPGNWGLDNRGNPKWIVRGNQIYLNSTIIYILRSTFFSSTGALGFRYKDLYKSSHPDRPESELPIPLVALAATGIHAALDTWKDGNYVKKKTDKFDGETYKTIFNRHVSYLQGLKTKNINAYHSIMAELHEKVVGNAGQGEQVEQAPGEGALSVLDLSGFD
ncbi:hypothetical protein BJ912DRAFT_1024284 [Pholiota molesta]|nr:hypothetical protein BJ912DRAFT_1024284 [Pholiota molesta]